jgi:hypothetical protein
VFKRLNVDRTYILSLQVEYHGQQDDLEEHPANKDDSLSQGNFGEIQTSATSKSPRMISADSGDHLFFEELVRHFKIFFFQYYMKYQ